MKIKPVTLDPLTVLECIKIAEAEVGKTIGEATIRRACARKHIRAKKFGASWAVNEPSFREWLKDYPHTGKHWAKLRAEKKKPKRKLMFPAD